MLRGRRARAEVAEPITLGRRLALVFGDLGPTFVKLGQMLTTRPDILPAGVLEGLRSLQNEVPPFDTETAKRIIAEEIGRPVDQCYNRL